MFLVVRKQVLLQYVPTRTHIERPLESFLGGACLLSPLQILFDTALRIESYYLKIIDLWARDKLLLEISTLTVD
jgi:hypothetical protein